jgi:hypothetical protein
MLKRVKGLGPKTFENACAFCMIDSGLDATRVHVEDYDIAEELLAGLSVEEYRERNKDPGEDEVQLTGVNLEKVEEVHRFMMMTSASFVEEEEVRASVRGGKAAMLHALLDADTARRSWGENCPPSTGTTRDWPTSPRRSRTLGERSPTS